MDLLLLALDARWVGVLKAPATSLGRVIGEVSRICNCPLALEAHLRVVPGFLVALVEGGPMIRNPERVPR
jgi:hypothetical protein